MSCQSCVIYFNIQFKIVLQTMLFQKCNYRLRVIIVLVLSWFHRFWFNQESTFKTLLATIIASHCKKLPHVRQLTFSIGIMQCHISFSSTPKNVVRSTQRNGCIYSIFNLHTGICNNTKVGISCCTIHITWIRKNVCGSPEQFHPRSILFCFCVINHFSQTVFNLENRSISNNISIVKTVKWNIHFCDKFECSIHFFFGSIHKVSSSNPWKHLCSRTKRISSCSAECVPVRNCKT